MCRTLLWLAFPLALVASPDIDASFSVDLTPLDYPQITADSQGNIIIAGLVRTCALPVVQPISSCGALWIGKLDPIGQTILFATYLGDSAFPSGASDSTNGFELQTDPNGNIVMVLAASKGNFPTVNAVQPTLHGSVNLYIFKLAADGSHLMYATYFGGKNYEVPVSLTVDAFGAAYVLDTTNSPNFPTTPNAVHSYQNGGSAIVKLTADGALEYSAVFPWVFTLQPITVDASGAVTLVATSPNALLKLSPDATSLTTTSIPSWANGMYYYPFAFTTSDGGLWVTGSEQNGNLPVTPNALESVTGSGPYLRVEDGTASDPSRIPAHTISSFAVDPADTTRIYAATDNGLFASSDNGMTWTSLTSLPSLAVAVDPFDSNLLYLGVAYTGGRNPNCYRSTDQGQTWTPVNSPLFTGSSTGIVSISADPNVPGLIYALGAGFYRSLDSGQTWAAAAVPPSSGGGDSPSSTYYFVPKSVVADPTHPNQVFLSGVEQCIGPCPVIGELLRSTDAGMTISNLSLPSSVFSYNPAADSLSIDPATGDLYLLGNGQLTVYPAANSYTPQLLANNVAAIAFDPASPGLIDEALTDGSIVQSPDGGATWNPVVQLPSNASLLAVSSDGVINASQPGGTTDAYAIRYDSDGNVSYGTYLSGGSTIMKSSAVTARDHLWIAGTTGPDLPLLNAVQPSFGGATDGFLAEFDSDGTLVSSTYLGGAANDEVDSVLPLAHGSVVAIGKTNSPDFLATLPPSAIGGGNTFILHLRR